jgi:hypothetical protein
MNLHGIVRGAISAVNPDRAITWQVSTGNTVGASGKQSPSYAAPVTIPRAQIQPVSGDALQFVNNLQQQGVYRSVYAYGDIEGIVRPELKGGDLLNFAMVLGGTVRPWLVVHVVETWTPDAAGWCHVVVALQETPP